MGAAGQLGEAIVARFSPQWQTIGLRRADLDLCDAAAVTKRVASLTPWAIVNCAGYNNVDGAEDEAVTALESNAFAVRTLARCASDANATFVHYSSDFVFDGEADRPYREEDAPRPQSVYAASKLLGEWFAADVAAHYVLRVESLFGGVSRRKSSLDRIIDNVTSGAGVRAFTDRVVSPSYVWDIADATAAVLEQRPAPGVYHCVNTGSATWHDLVMEVRRIAGSHAVIEPITTQQVKLRAARPRYCALSNDKLRNVGIVMPSWQDAIVRALHERTASGSS